MEPVKIHPPEGYEVCPTSTQTEIRFRPISKSKPKWEDFGKLEGWYLDVYGYVIKTHDEVSNSLTKTIWPTKEEAEACLALSQLCQWRDKYNGAWRDNKKDYTNKWCINVYKGEVSKDECKSVSNVLTFQTREIRDKFLEDFSSLIEIAKPLL